MKFPHKNLLPLIILAGLCAIVLSITHDLSKERISENIRMEKLQVIGAVMPPDFIFMMTLRSSIILMIPEIR